MPSQLADANTFEAIAATEPSFVEACNAVSLRVASLLVTDKLTYESADEVMNWIWSNTVTWLGRGGPLPEPAASIFEAVDAGEYHHHGDDPDLDPVQTYTLPAIRKILLNNR